MIRAMLTIVLIMAVISAGELATLLPTAGLGLGHCKVIRPRTGQCACARYVPYDCDPGRCGECYHSMAMHAAELGDGR